jgi:Alpha-2,8-polysialyltransferase (POLYST)
MKTEQNSNRRQVLLCVQGTAQLLAAIAAAKYREQFFPHQTTDYILVVYDLLAQQQDSAFMQAIFELAMPWQFSRKVFLDAPTLKQLVKSYQSRSQKIQKLRDLIGVAQVDEIYLCRNYIGYGSNLLLHAYSQAKKITYGDTYGIVCRRAFFEQYAYMQKNPWKQIWNRGVRTVKDSMKRLIGWELPMIEFDLALLTTPIDYCGGYLSQIEYEFIPLSILEHVIQTTRKAIASKYQSSLQMLLGDRPIDLLLLTSNLTESNYTCLENEVALYVDPVQKLVPCGSHIAIKPHPRASAGTAERIQAELIALGYSVDCLIDQEFNFIPIEVVIPFLQPRLIASLGSTAAINLALFSDINQVALHDESLLQRYLNPSAIAMMLDFQHSLSACLDKIEQGWRGGEILWSRPHNLLKSS